MAVSARQLLRVLDGDAGTFPLAAHDAARRATFRSQVRGIQVRVTEATEDNRRSRGVRQRQLEDQRAAEEAMRKAAEEAARIAAEEAARQAAEEAERAAAAAAARRPPPGSSPSRPSSSSRPSAPTATPSAPPPPSSGGGGSSTYTGCRSYAPGGKTWTPIPC